MEYKGIASITSPVNDSWYDDLGFSGEIEFEDGKKPWRMAGVIDVKNPTVLDLYNDLLQLDGSTYAFVQYPREVYMSTKNEDEIDMGDRISYKALGVQNTAVYKHSFGKWNQESTNTESYTVPYDNVSVFTGLVDNKDCRWFKVVDVIRQGASTPNSAKGYGSKDWFNVTWSESLPCFATDDEAILYVNGFIDDSSAVKKAWDPDDDTNEENDNDTDSSQYDTTPFNSPQVTPMMISGANNYYCVNVANVNAFVQWLWDDLIKEGTLSEWLLDSITKISGNLYSCITGLKLFPCNIKKHLATVANTPLVLGRFNGGFEVIDATSYNCKIGSIEYKIPSGYNNFLDYQPYTTGVLYLPFVGFSQLDMTIFQPGKTMKIDCFVDITTGVIDYAVSLKNDKGGYSLIETHTGTCGINIPLSYDDASNWLQNFVGDSIKGGVNTIMSKGATSLGQVASDASGSLLDSFDTPTSYNVGSPSPCNGLFMPFEPHIVIRRPKYSRPSTYSKNVGYPCMKSYAPKDLSGFTIFQNPQITFGHTKNSEGQKVLPTKEEMDMLYQLMTEGVYL